MIDVLILIGCVIMGPWLLKDGIDALKSGETASPIVSLLWTVSRKKTGVKGALHRLLFWISVVTNFLFGSFLCYVSLLLLYQFFQ